MTDPVSRSQLEEALRQWDDGEGEYEVAETLSETARAVLSAPTVRWCKVHHAEEFYKLEGEGFTICWKVATDTHGDPAPCRIVTTVALVPVKDT